MEVTPKIKIDESLSQLGFFDIEYYDDNKVNELGELLTELIKSDFQRLYFSVGRYDMFYEDDLDDLNISIRRRVLEIGKGKLAEVYYSNEENFAYAGYFELSKIESIKLIIDIFKVFYSCSIEFFPSKEVNFADFITTIKIKYKKMDYDSKRLFSRIPFEYSFF